MTEENVSGTLGALDNSVPTDDIISHDEVVVQNDEPKAKEIVEEVEEGLEEAQENEHGEQEVKKPKLTGWQRKIQKLERELEAERARKAEATAPVVKFEGEPLLENFETYDDYNKAMVRYEAKQLLKNELDERDKRAKQTQQEQSWNTKIANTVRELPDYHEVMAEYADTPMRQEIIDIVKESDIGPKMAYHLAKNPELLDEINTADVSSYKIFAKLATLESELGSKSQAKAVVKTTKSPPPITPIKKSTPTTIDLDAMSADDFIAFRNKKK